MPPTTQSLNPNHRYQANATSATSRTTWAPARTTSRRARNCRGRRWPTSASATATSFSSSTTASRRAQICRTRPINSDHRLETWGVFAQDRWMIGRATINAGVRIDGVRPICPRSRARPEPGSASGLPGARSVRLLGRTWRRASASPTTCSATAGPRSRPITAGSTTSSDRSSRETSNPNALVQLAGAVERSERQSAPRPGRAESRDVHRLHARALPADRSGCERPYSDEINVGHRSSAGRQSRRVGSAIIAVSIATDSASSIGRGRAAAYTPVDAHLHRSRSEAPQTITVYNLDPAFVTRARSRDHQCRRAQERLRRRACSTINKRHVESLAAAGRPDVPERTRASRTAGPTPNPGTITDFNNPNYVLNRDNSVGVHRYAVGVQALGQLPAAVRHRVLGQVHCAAPAIRSTRTLVVSGLQQGTETIWVQPRGVDRTETSTVRRHPVREAVDRLARPARRHG